MTKKIISLILLFIVGFPAIAKCQNGIDDNVISTVSEVKVLCKKRFTIGYSTQHKSPLWVIERIRREDLARPEFKRPSSFKTDPTISTNHQLSPRSCNLSGFDRGHLVAFENVADDAASIEESFYLTNVVCQYPKHNRATWKTLESAIRKIADKNEEIIVVTGISVSAEKLNTQAVGGHDYMWKIVIAQKSILIYFIPHTNNKLEAIENYRISPAEFNKRNGHVNLNTPVGR